MTFRLRPSGDFKDHVAALCSICAEEYVDEETGLCPACDEDEPTTPSPEVPYSLLVLTDPTRPRTIY